MVLAWQPGLKTEFHNEVLPQWKLPPEKFRGAQCPEHGAALRIVRSLLVCDDCRAEYGGHHYGRFYPRKCRDCGKPFLTRVFHQARCGHCAASRRRGI